MVEQIKIVEESKITYSMFLKFLAIWSVTLSTQPTPILIIHEIFLLIMAFKLRFTDISKNFQTDEEKEIKLITAESKIFRMKHQRDSRRKKSDSNSGSINADKTTAFKP